MTKKLLLLAVAVCGVTAPAADQVSLNDLYKHLHTTPELSFDEVNTAKRMAAELRAEGFEVTEGFGGHGIVGMLKNGKGPTVMIRADMDGLPIEEKTNRKYASTVVAQGRDGQPTPVMHACGHDIHMSVFVGTARRMSAEKSTWSGTLMMIAQPAEERSGGAKAMLAEGLFEKFPRPDYNLAIHVASDMAAGDVGAVAGYFMANVDSVDIVVRGQGGHGAYPNRGKDPVVLAAELVMALQTIVSREISPLEPAVVTVGSIHGGKQHNIIPDSVKLQLTLRSYSPDVRNQTIAAIRRLAEHMGRAHGLPEVLLPVVTVLDEYTPAAYNNPELTQQVLDVFRAELGKEHVVPVIKEMVGEDFGRYGSVTPAIPSLMFRLGTVAPARLASAQASGEVLPGLHSAYFAPAYEPTIATGVKAMTAAALELLSKN